MKGKIGSYLSPTSPGIDSEAFIPLGDSFIYGLLEDEQPI